MARSMRRGVSCRGVSPVQSIIYQGVCSFSVLKFIMILVWNLRGAIGEDFSLTLREMKKNLKPKVVVLLETRCSGAVAQKAIKKWGFRNQILEEARGLSGGI